jgi:hypothetical protein
MALRVFLGACYSLSALNWTVYLTYVSSLGLSPLLWRSARIGMRLLRIRRMLSNVQGRFNHRSIDHLLRSNLYFPLGYELHARLPKI